MPYKGGNRLGPETASKLGHLEVLNSAFVNDVIAQFEQPILDSITPPEINWRDVNTDAKPLKYIFAADGSLQHISSTGNPKREVSFVKTALLRLDPHVIEKIDPEYPHPNQLKKAMLETAQYHATVFPLKNIKVRGTDWMFGIRQLIFDSFKDPALSGAPYETLKWLLFQKWEPRRKHPSPSFECPDCFEPQAGLPYDADHVRCNACSTPIFATDVIGLHMEMSEESASESLGSSYMLVHETIMLLTAVKYLWERNPKVLEETLFLKDGPLTLRGQYSKLVPNIRNFLSFAKDQNRNVHICGQEKTGRFVDFLQGTAYLVKPQERGEPARYSVMSHDFIHKQVQRIREPKYPYGYRTNYGEKIFLKQSPHHIFVLSVPTGQYLNADSKPDGPTDFIGIDRILATIPRLISYRHESALVPIELVNGIASLSSYPSATVLKLFSGLE